MGSKIFNPEKLHKLNHPGRLESIPPKFILEKVGLENPEIIIDLGAGTGFFSAPISKVFQEAKIYACDISDIMINWMEENIAPKHNNITPLKMEDSSIPLDDNNADFLFMINLHHELGNPSKTLNECHRLLKPKAKIAISDWKKTETQRGPSVQIKVAPETIKEQLLSAGFENISIYNDLETNYLVVAEKK